MPRIVVRKGYRCLPGKRRELLAALQRVDAAATAAGWPRGRYLFVETKSPGEPDLEVEFTFETYAEMEQLERRLREHLGRVARDVGSAGQELLLEPSATRHLLLLDEPATRPAMEPGQPVAGPRNGAGGAVGAAAREPDGPPTVRANAPAAPHPPPPLTPPPATAPRGAIGNPPLTVAQERARQLSAARAAMESAERTVGLPPEKRASQRQQPVSNANRGAEDRAPNDPEDDDSLDATA